MESEQSGAQPSGGSGLGKVIVIAILAMLLIAALVFGGWAYSKMQDYKNNTNQKVAVALQNAKDAQTKQVQDAFDKANTKQFQGSPTYGSITFNYPKTWSAYNDSTSSEPINAYFHPDVVPGTQSKTAYALRVELLSTDYAQIMQTFSTDIAQGHVTARAYVPPKLQGAANVTAGTYLSGQVNDQDTSQLGNMVVLKVRDKTLKIYSESDTFANDFNNVVLASLTFAP